MQLIYQKYFYHLGCTGPCCHMLVSEQTPITKNRTVAIVANLEKQHSLQLEFMITEEFATEDWYNLYHATISGDHDAYGARTPGIWIQTKDGSISVYTTSAVNGIMRTGWNSPPTPIQLNTWMRINVTQAKVKNDYQFDVEVNGEVIETVNNTQTEAFENVTMYISNPWDQVGPGYVRNVFLKGKVLFITLSIDVFSFWT